jgi:hypothetical protein
MVRMLAGRVVSDRHRMFAQPPQAMDEATNRRASPMDYDL